MARLNPIIINIDATVLQNWYLQAIGSSLFVNNWGRCSGYLNTLSDYLTFLQTSHSAENIFPNSIMITFLTSAISDSSYQKHLFSSLIYQFMVFWISMHLSEANQSDVSCLAPSVLPQCSNFFSVSPGGNVSVYLKTHQATSQKKFKIYCCGHQVKLWRDKFYAVQTWFTLVSIKFPKDEGRGGWGREKYIFWKLYSGYF